MIKDAQLRSGKVGVVKVVPRVVSHLFRNPPIFANSRNRPK